MTTAEPSNFERMAVPLIERFRRSGGAICRRRKVGSCWLLSADSWLLGGYSAAQRGFCGRNRGRIFQPGVTGVLCGGCWMGPEIRVLGPLEVRANGSTLDVSGAAAVVLAALLAAPSRAASLGDLISALWGTRPPTGPEKAVQSYMSRLRRALGDHADVVVTRRPGYVLDVDPAGVDAVVFERLVGEGLRAASVGAFVVAARHLRDAEALWRGDAYQDFQDVPFAVRERGRLAEMRIDAREAAIAAELAGSPRLAGESGLIEELEGLVARHPLRERLWAHLVVALYRVGRQADALAAYQRARDTLVEEV